MVSLPDGEQILKICLFVLTYPRTWQTDGRTDRHRMTAIAALVHSIARQKLWQYVKSFSSNTGTSLTDERTDGHNNAMSISRVSMLTRDKNSTPFKIVTHEIWIWKLATWLRRGHHPTCNFWVESVQCGANSHAEWLKRRVSAQGRSFYGSARWVTLCLQNSPKGEWIGSFKPTSQHVYIAISPELLIRRTSDLRIEFRPRNAFCALFAITPKQIQHGWQPPSWKSIWRHISAVDGPVWTKFGTLMQNNTPITAKWSRSKPEVDFQYGGSLFFKTGRSYISAVNWDMSTKFGLLVDFKLLKAVTSTNTKPDVVLSGRGRHLEKSIWRHIFAVGGPIWMKFGSLMQNSTLIAVI